MCCVAAPISFAVVLLNISKEDTKANITHFTHFHVCNIYIVETV